MVRRLLERIGVRWQFGSVGYATAKLVLEALLDDWVSEAVFQRIKLLQNLRGVGGVVSFSALRVLHWQVKRVRSHVPS